MSTDADVLVVAAEWDVPEGMIEALEATGSKVSRLDLDKTDHDGSKRKLTEHLTTHPTPTVLVNVLPSRHAGMRAELVTNADIHDYVELKLTRTLVSCQEIGKAMLETGKGTIVFVLAGVPDDPLANVTDTAVTGLMRVLSVEWANAGVRVLAVSPTGAPSHARDAAVSDTITFLISDDASYITGTAVQVRAPARVETEAA